MCGKAFAVELEGYNVFDAKLRQDGAGTRREKNEEKGDRAGR